MAASRTHYQTLNVSPDAEGVVIEAAYRALMKKYHPDQGAPPPAPGAPSAADINEAYAVLREPGRRADYDRTEWTRQQSIQLASYVPPPPRRRTNFFGWGGWLVALVLAGMIGLLASRGQVGALSPAERARAASMAEPDLRSQPFKRGEGALSDSDVAEIRADAYVRPVPPAVTPSESTATLPDAAPAPLPETSAAPPPEASVSLAPRRVQGARAWRKPARRAAPRTRGAREHDFLERQGYIY
jgi:curved DNA-binding protein CbpA